MSGTGAAVEPYRIEVADADLDELRVRLRRTRWPDEEPVGDWSQGVPRRWLEGLCRQWADDYDWRATERRLNQIPQFRTEIDGLAIHFLHVRSPEPSATPVVLTHGWPGSFLEFEQALGPLTDPSAHGAPPGDAFHVVVPSLPGYAFSDRPASTGWDIHRIARAWCELMTRLGYPRFIAAGSDWGTSISTSIARQHPERLLGLHLVPPLVAPDRTAGDLTPAEQAALADLDQRSRTGSGYSAMHGTRPQTTGYALLDSPAGLAAWIGEKLVSWADPAGGGLTPEQMLDNLSLYWLTGTAASSARLYWESIAEVSAWFTSATIDTISVPAGCTVFPAEVPRPSRRWAERRFTEIVHWGEPARGGHFGAWEQPGLFASELRETRQALARLPQARPARAPPAQAPPAQAPPAQTHQPRPHQPRPHQPGDLTDSPPLPHRFLLLSGGLHDRGGFWVLGHPKSSTLTPTSSALSPTLGLLAVISQAMERQLVRRFGHRAAGASQVT